MYLEFKEESLLKTSATIVIDSQLNLHGVNYELGPFLRMSCPKEWKHRTLSEWPTGKQLFSSVIFAFGFVPIDLHKFFLVNTSENGFEERSTSLMNSLWAHCRVVEQEGEYCRVRDNVQFSPRIGVVGILIKPLYQAVFKHRHKRLRARFGEKLI
jgi:hypothetical protein